MLNATEEIWIPIKGFETFYQISNYGRVKSLSRIISYNKSGKEKLKNIPERILKPSYRQDYAYVVLAKNGTNKKHSIHRLLAEHFIPKIYGKNYVNHIDCNRRNNSLDNLEWCTISENTKHAYKHQRLLSPRVWTGKKGKNHPTSRKVKQLDLNGKIIKIWDSLADVYRELNISQSHIVQVCTGKRNTAKGFKWSY